jgi:CheY-like chemotaxis protein
MIYAHLAQDCPIRLFQSEGYTVGEAANGQDALQQIEKVLPRLILLDLWMPVMDGGLFLTELRARDVRR